MTQDLDNLLGSLHSDKNRLAFLNQIYTTGNIEVADRLLGLTPSTSVLEKEVRYAREHGDTERFTTLARRFIDHYIENNWDILLEDEVMGWGNPDVADYAITKLEETGRESSLKYAGEIARSFGQTERERELLERVLAVQMEKEDEYAFSPAGTCVKLGRFDEAIDLFMRSGYRWLDSALNVAREHVPERTNEIAQRGFDEYAPTFHTQEIYVECAEILDKVDEAKKTLTKESKKLKPDRPPRFYQGLVSSLVKLGLNNVARTAVEKVATYQFQRAREREEGSIHLSFHDEQKELARLYETIGEQAQVKDILLARIDAGLNGDWDPSNYTGDIEKGSELTGDKAFLERKLLSLEKEQKYDEASQLAGQLGNSELAESYKTMHQMVSAIPKKD
jgi:hypothetical protein